MIINSAKELKVYKTAYKLSMEIFERVHFVFVDRLNLPKRLDESC